MTPEKVNVPEGAKVYNFLYRSTDPEYLVQDILSVQLANGFCIDAGWYPEHDLEQGSYLIRAYRGSWQNQIGNPVRTRDIDELIETVEGMANLYSGTQLRYSASSSEYQTA